MDNKGQMQLMELFTTAILFILGFYIFLTVSDPILNNVLFPCLDGTTCNAPANGGVIKILFNLVTLVLGLLGFLYLMGFLSRPREQTPTY